MRVLDLAIDPEAVLDVLAELVGLSLFEMEVFLAWLAMSLGFGVLMWAIWETRRWRSPVGKLMRGRYFGGV